MHSIVILNPKGGCGKSTLAVNLAGYFAQLGKRVALADCDPQRSSSDWLAIRPESAPTITPAGFSNGRIKVAARAIRAGRPAASSSLSNLGGIFFVCSVFAAAGREIIPGC